MKDDSMVKARKALDGLWRETDLKGRCWGLRRNGNRYQDTNITLAQGKELVTISMDKEGRLLVHVFRKAKKSSLGETIKEALQAAALPLAD